MELEDLESALFDNYQKWIADSSIFTAEVAAFEYLKRNPYFIDVVHYFNNEMKAIRDEHERNEELISIAEYTKKMFSRLFLYTGIDLLNHNEIYLGSNSTFHNIGHLLAYNKQITKTSDVHYGYSKIYSLYSSKEMGRSSTSYKKDHIVDIDMLLANNHSQRWLEHLRPSLYIRINPQHSHSKLKSDLEKMLNTICGQYPEYASSEFMINEYGKPDTTFRAPTLQANKSIIGLILYDACNVFNVHGANELIPFLRKYFSRGIVDEYFSSFLTENKKNFEGGYIYAQKYGRTINEVKNRIYGGYLQYLYTNETINAHFEIMRQEFYQYEQNEDIESFINDLKSKSTIEERLKHLFVDVRCYETKEYDEYSEKVYDGSMISKEDLLEILLF